MLFGSISFNLTPPLVIMAILKPSWPMTVSGVHAKSCISLARDFGDALLNVASSSRSANLQSSKLKALGRRALASCTTLCVGFFIASSFRRFVICSSFNPLVRFRRRGTSLYFDKGESLPSRNPRRRVLVCHFL